MTVFHSIDELEKSAGEVLRGNTSVALGNFDGVHIGHVEIIKTAVEMAREGGFTSVCYTFSNHPQNMGIDLEAGEEPRVKLITTDEEKIRLIDELGVDICLSLPFDESTMNTAAEDFIREVLVDKLGAKVICCGFNYRFGSGAAGDAELLRKFGEKLGYNTCVHEAVSACGDVVSSSRIRSLIVAGEMDECTSCLGRPYQLAGIVTPGNQIGRRIGFPTANFQVNQAMETPPNGVYYCRTGVLREDSEKADNFTDKYYWYNSISNIGVKPTISKNVSEASKTVETNIFDFEGDLYGREIRVEFLKFARPEQRFASIDDLKAQIAEDKAAALDYF